MYQPLSRSSAANGVRSAWPRLCAGAAAATLVALAWPSTAAAETAVGVDLALNDSIAGDDAGSGAGEKCSAWVESASIDEPFAASFRSTENAMLAGKALRTVAEAVGLASVTSALPPPAPA